MTTSLLGLPVSLLIVATLLMCSTPRAQGDEPYRLPPPDVADVVKAPRLPSVSIDPTQQRMLLVERQTMPTITDMAQPMLRLAGRRINPDTNGMHGNTGLVGMTLVSLGDNAKTPIRVPANVRLGSPVWSPNGRRFAFTITDGDGIRVAVGDARDGSTRVIPGQVNGIGGAFRWMPDGERLLVSFVPRDRGPAPEPPVIPSGPVVQEASSRTSPVRTYQDLLKSPHDEALFDHYFTAQLAMVDVNGGPPQLVGAPAIYTRISASPTGRYLLTTRVQRPYSYQVPIWSFPTTTEVRELATGGVTTIAVLPLADQTPIGGVPVGRRSIGWMSLEDSNRLVWAEALDGGDPDNEASHRDKVMMLDAPFAGEPREVYRTEHRFTGITWIERSSHALFGEYDRDRRWSRTWVIDVGAEQSTPRLLWDRSSRDRYADPGRPMMTTNKAGRGVAMLDEGRLWLSGRGASPAGDRPFLDRLDLRTFETERLWRCGDDALEAVVDVLDRNGSVVLTKHETRDTPPNYFAVNLKSGAREPVTEFEHPAPQLRDIHKELVRYKRDDGVDLSATLYLPPGYDPERDGPLPLVVWAYPREFNDPYTAGQVSGSDKRFTMISGSSHLFLLLQGFAVMDAATMPVVGDDPETVNDSFIKQIVASAKAAIDYAVERGVADPERVGVGGHSYGAFMTANLLAHCDLFRAGIARSGAYNRTLTPFGFQSERRTFWEAPDIYFKLSPFMHANHIDEPILLIHGERDNNSGTFPIQSERLYHAVKGHGGTVRLVMLPYESHGYRAEESVMHVLAEMIDWFEEHVKSPASMSTTPES